MPFRWESLTVPEVPSSALELWVPEDVEEVMLQAPRAFIGDYVYERSDPPPTGEAGPLLFWHAQNAVGGPQTDAVRLYYSDPAGETDAQFQVLLAGTLIGLAVSIVSFLLFEVGSGRLLRRSAPPADQGDTAAPDVRDSGG